VRASIVIVTYGQREVTERCLRSLEACLGDRLGRDFELVLVDNASPDDTPDLLRAWSGRATVALLEANRNFAGGCNEGARLARGEVLIFLNNDTEVVPGALEALVDQALEPGVAAAGCRLLFPDGTAQHAGVAFLRNAAGAVMPQHVFHHQDGDLPVARATWETDCVTAACLAVRASAFHAVGGFDEGYRNGLEDVDLCLKLRVAGHTIVYRGDIAFVHHEGASRGQGNGLWATPERLAAMRDNDVRFVRTWGQLLDEDEALAAELWDARLQDRPVPVGSEPATVVIEGQPGGWGPAADESRALLQACAAAGVPVAARDNPFPRVTARLGATETAALAVALARAPVPGALRIVVPAGNADRHALDATCVVRATSRGDFRAAGAIWAATPALAAELGGTFVPPAIAPVALGTGRGGILAVLPAHDRAAATATLTALRDAPACTPVRLLPTVATRGLGDDVAAALPGAELLAPCSDEQRFAALAATADVVLAADRDDRFERRALLAAATGAAVVIRPDGPAATVLGSLRSADLRSALAAAEGRAARAARVRAACDPSLIARRLIALTGVAAA
jgi:GT2 family glycosyltransferase